MMFPRRSVFVLALPVVLSLPPLLAAPARAEDTHTLQAPPAKGAVGQVAVVEVTIEGRNGWHINQEAPVSIKLSPAQGVSVAKPRLGRADLAESSDDRARFAVQATPNVAGRTEIAAEANFVMCQETACKPVRETLTLQVTGVDEAEAAKPKGGSQIQKKKAPKPGSAGSSASRS